MLLGTNLRYASVCPRVRRYTFSNIGASLARLSPRLETIRGLFARSGNQCALPGCIHPLVNEKQKFIGQVCHIEAAMPDGERYNPKQTDEERRSYENLLILCYQHHIETDKGN